MGSRGYAGAAAVIASVAAGCLVFATAGTAMGAYVSESGIAGAPRAGVYRVGILAVAVALLVLSRAVPRLPGLLLLAAVPFAVTSGVVTCTAGCPLPPYEATTARDVLHAAAAILALGLTALAMLAAGWLPGASRGPLLAAGARRAALLAVDANKGPLPTADASRAALLAWLRSQDTDPALARVSRICSLITVPLLAISAGFIAFAGRGTLAGLTERLAIAASCVWLILAAATVALRGGDRADPVVAGDAPRVAGSAPGAAVDAR